MIDGGGNGRPRFAGAALVLTIFEYLRKRASDSVLAGVQDAIEFLNGKPAAAARPAADAPAKGVEQRKEESAPQSSPFDAQNYLAGPGPANDAAAENLPPPRRRGRPPRTERQNGAE